MKNMTDNDSPTVDGAIMPVQTTELKCRFYEEELPQIDEVVVAKVSRIEDMGAYANLLEYNNREGMILMSELSRRRIRSVNKLVRVGRDEFVMVLRADRERGYIDLSKRRAGQEEHAAADNRYQKQKQVVSIITYAAKQLGFTENSQLEDLMRRTTWHFDKKYARPDEAHKASFTYFRKAVEDPTVFDECDVTDEEKAEIISIIKNRMTPSPDEIRADFSVRCTGPDGIEAIKAALQAGVAASRKSAVALGLCSEADIQNQIENHRKSLTMDKEKSKQKLGAAELPINELRINLLSSPQFVSKLKTLEKEKGMLMVKASLKAIEEKIQEYNHGEFKIVKEPKIVGQSDIESLKNEMARLEAETRQVAGDDAE